MHAKDKRWFLLALFCAAALMLALNWFTPLLADDYHYAFRFDADTRVTSVADIFPSLAAHARNMNGRLSPHFFVQLFTLLPRRVFAVVNTAVYLLFLLGAYTLVKPVGARWNWKLLLIVQGALFLLTPAFGQSYLWLSGSDNYLWCDTLMLWLLVPFAGILWKGQRSPTVPVQLLMALGALVLGNMSENVSACAALLMGLCVLWQWCTRRKAPAWMLVTTAMTVLGWLLLMLAPANRESVARASGGLNVLADHYRAALNMWLEHGLWASLAFVGLLCFVNVDRDRKAFACMAFLSSLVCNFMMVAADYYPERAFTGTVVFLIVACATLLDSPTVKLTLTSALALGLTLVMALSAVGAVPDAYNRYQLAQARVAEVCQARDAGQTDVTTFGITGLSRFDAFDGLNELTTDPDYFPNAYYAKYYGLSSIGVDRFE